MQEFKLNGRMTVTTMKDLFKTLTGGTLRVKDGNKKADESATLASIRKDSDNKNGALELNPEMTIGDFKAKMLSDFGLKVEVGTPDDWVSVPDGITLGQLRELPKNATKAQLEALVIGKTDIASDNVDKATTETNQNNNYPTYEECCAKFKPGKKADRVKYSDDGKTLEEVNATFEGSLIIPEGVETLKRCNSDKVTAIVMPDSVTKIGFREWGWNDLEFVRLSRGLTEIPDGAFRSTSVHEWQFPEGLKIIGKDCFKGEYSDNGKIKRVTLPSTLEYILSDAFQDNALEEIVIPANVKAIFPGAFSKNEKLKEVKFMSDETVVLEGAFADCPLIDAEAICKAHQLGDRVLGADEVRYEDKYINNGEHYVLTPCLTYIPSYYCGRLKVKDGTEYLSNTREKVYLGGYAGITELYLPDSIKDASARIKNYPKNVTTLHVPDETTELDLRDCKKIRSFNWPKKLTRIIALKDTDGIENLEIPDGVIEIGNEWGDCISNLPNLKNISIPDSVTAIMKNSFCNLPAVASIKIPVKIERIENGCFCNTGMKHLELPAGLKEIGEDAFRNNAYLEEVTIPASVETIGAGAFSGCTSLKKINFEGKPKMNVTSFENCPGYEVPEVELPTLEKDENGLPVVKLNFAASYSHKTECLEDMELDYSCASILAVSKSEDAKNYPFDNLTWLSFSDEYTGCCYYDFESEDEQAAHQALRWSFWMAAIIDDGYGDRYDEKVLKRCTRGLALCIGDPEIGNVKGEDYDGPEAIFDLTVDYGKTHLRYHIFKNEESGKWEAEEIDNAE